MTGVVAKRGGAIRAERPTLLPEAKGRWYRAPLLKPRGTRDRHDRLLPNDICPCGTGKKFKRCHRDASAEERRELGDAATLDHALASARPLLIDTGMPEWPLMRSGSCMLVTFRKDLWIVSTAHAFKNFQSTPDRARVPWNIGGGTLRPLRITGEYVSPRDDSDDTVWSDFVVIRCAERAPRWWKLLDLDCADLADLDHATGRDWLRAFGFANAMGNEVDCQAGRVVVSACSFDGKYAGPTESKRVHAIALPSTGVVNDVNGMSGGPVFYTRQANEAWVFAGILVSGSAESKLLRVIDARAIRATLRAFYARENDQLAPDASQR